MKVIKSKLDGALILEPKIFGDERGFFYEVYQMERYRLLGISENFVQDNRSRSSKGVLRGLHFQKTKPQGKLVTVTSGVVFDVAVDLRKDSPTFGEHEVVVLSGDNHLQFYIPPGFAHGFYVMSEFADFQYKCTDYYDHSDESGLLWNDPSLNIDWPVSDPVLSEKDKSLPLLESIRENIIHGWCHE